jgi:hypothetical protein
MGAKRRWGYLVWAVAGGVIGVPEITAAVDHGALPFTTISEMTGHLERRHSWVELLVVGLIVFVAFSVVRLPPRRRAGAAGESGGPARTPGGRLTVQPKATPAAGATFHDDEAPVWFVIAAFGSWLVVALATLGVIHWWDDPRHFHPAYALYGLVALFWVAIPSVFAFASGKDAPFPTLFQTVLNLEAWLRSRSWRHNLGPVAGWLVGYVLLWGLVVLLLHLTLYPYPDITKILNPGG